MTTGTYHHLGYTNLKCAYWALKISYALWNFYCSPGTEQIWIHSLFVTVRNSSWGKVMFSQVSVCPQGGGVHPPRRQPLPPRQDTPLASRHPPRDGYCSGWYASYWDAFLFTFCPEMDLTFLYYEPSWIDVETVIQLEKSMDLILIDLLINKVSTYWE